MAWGYKRSVELKNSAQFILKNDKRIENLFDFVGDIECN